jgi:hypothetical protein
LRPRNASFTLAKRFNFDVSLFERMVKNGFPCYTLATQHRMRPEISALMKPIYPFLMDHKSVNHRSNISGVTKNIYFIHHKVPEEKVSNIVNYKVVVILNNLLTSIYYYYSVFILNLSDYLTN